MVEVGSSMEVEERGGHGEGSLDKPWDIWFKGWGEKEGPIGKKGWLRVDGRDLTTSNTAGNEPVEAACKGLEEGRKGLGEGYRAGGS